jgi:hypothetical protein
MKARENPFRTDRTLSLGYRPQSLAWGEIMERLSHMGYRAAIVCPEGSGKTTLLEALAANFSAQGFSVKNLRLDSLRRTFPRGFLKSFVTPQPRRGTRDTKGNKDGNEPDEASKIDSGSPPFCSRCAFCAFLWLCLSSSAMSH